MPSHLLENKFEPTYCNPQSRASDKDLHIIIIKFTIPVPALICNCHLCISYCPRFPPLKTCNGRRQRDPQFGKAPSYGVLVCYLRLYKYLITRVQLVSASDSFGSLLQGSIVFAGDTPSFLGYIYIRSLILCMFLIGSGPEK